MANADAVDRPVQQAMQRWIRTVMLEHGWSAEEWARQAGTTPTNITRVLGERPSLPNAGTLARLARAAGSQPDLLGAANNVAVSVPLLDHAQVLALLPLGAKERQRFLERARADRPAMQVHFRPSSSAFAVSLESDSLRGRGFYARDVVVVEPGDFSPVDVGTVTAAIVEREISAWLWFPPLLVPAHEAKNPVPLRDARLLGRVLQLQRRLP